MAAIDHSLTYKKLSIRNLPHILRKKDLEKVVDRLRLPKKLSYADFGCSNGFLTKIISEKIQAREAFGFDHTEQNLKIARESYKSIEFNKIDLNQVSQWPRKFDFITCLETIEHVGNPKAALETILNAVSDSGKILISLPIEVGSIGLLKFFTKNYIYRYSLDEISENPETQKKYKKALWKGDRLTKFRDPNRLGWGTHYGFDYRDFEDMLLSKNLNFKAWSSFATRFYLIDKTQVASS